MRRTVSWVTCLDDLALGFLPGGLSRWADWSDLRGAGMALLQKGQLRRGGSGQNTGQQGNGFDLPGGGGRREE